MIAPVKRRAARAQAFLAVSQRSSAGQRRTEVQRRSGIFQMQRQIWVAQSVGRSATGCGGGPHEIYRRADCEPKMRVEIVTNISVHLINLAVGVRRCPKFHIRSYAAFLR